VVALLSAAILACVPAAFIAAWRVAEPVSALEMSSSSDPIVWTTVLLVGLVPGSALGLCCLYAERGWVGSVAAVAFLAAAGVAGGVVVSADVLRPYDPYHLMIVAGCADGVPALVASFLPLRDFSAAGR